MYYFYKLFYNKIKLIVIYWRAWNMTFKSDIEIAQESRPLHIREIGKKLGLSEDDLELYGKYKAKIDYNLLKTHKRDKKAKLILTTAINPTPAGEGKTTTTIGVADGLQ